MLTQWLTYQERSTVLYKFKVVDVIETCQPSEDVRNHVAHNLLAAHVDPQMLVDDLRDIGLSELASYLQKHLPEKTIIKVGNFGEVLAATLLIEFESFWLPIYKLRFRDKNNWAIRLTDLCLIGKTDKGIPIVCYGEVKTLSSGKKTSLAVDGHESLAKDDALSDPEILRFITNMLFQLGKHNEHKLFRDIWLGRIKYEQRHDLFLIHEKDYWEDLVLDQLQAIELDKRLIDFSVKVVLVTGLRDLIEESFRRCEPSLKALM